jgi:hypothetical protein
MSIGWLGGSAAEASPAGIGVGVGVGVGAGLGAGLPIGRALGSACGMMVRSTTVGPAGVGIGGIATGSPGRQAGSIGAACVSVLPRLNVSWSLPAYVGTV